MTEAVIPSERSESRDLHASLRWRIRQFLRHRRSRSVPSLRTPLELELVMIRKLKSGEYRLYSRKKDPKTGKRRNLGTFKTRAAAEKHEKAVQFFKRRG